MESFRHPHSASPIPRIPNCQASPCRESPNFRGKIQRNISRKSKILILPPFLQIASSRPYLPLPPTHPPIKKWADNNSGIIATNKHSNGTESFFSRREESAGQRHPPSRAGIVFVTRHVKMEIETEPEGKADASSGSIQETCSTGCCCCRQSGIRRKNRSIWMDERRHGHHPPDVGRINSGGCIRADGRTCHVLLIRKLERVPAGILPAPTRLVPGSESINLKGVKWRRPWINQGWMALN